MVHSFRWALSRLGWYGRAALLALLAFALSEVSWMVPHLTLGLVFLYALLLAGWYSLFVRLALRQLPTDRRRAAQLLASLAAIVATLPWMMLDRPSPILGCIHAILTFAPLLALGWPLIGSARGAAAWMRRIVAVLTALFLPHLVLPMTPGQTDYYYHWPRYHRVVAEVRAADLRPGECRRFAMNNRYFFLVLAPQSESNGSAIIDRTGDVHAYRSDEGRLLVSIMTADFHHAGRFGYLYADDRADLDTHDRCLPVLGNTTRRMLGEHWEAFRWD